MNVLKLAIFNTTQQDYIEHGLIPTFKGLVIKVGGIVFKPKYSDLDMLAMKITFLVQWYFIPSPENTFLSYRLRILQD